jgi:hypothetical protein
VGDAKKESLLKGARENREAIRKFAEMTLGGDVKDDEITAIVVRVRPSGRGARRGRGSEASETVRIELGEPLDRRLADTPDEPVLAILRSLTYLVCTPNRGVIRGEPYLFGDK